MIAFFVAGVPRGQGNHRTSPSGHIYETTKGHRAWRHAVAHAAMTHRRRHPIDGPVRVDLCFEMPRPQRTKRWLPSVKPDLSKLIRNVEDGLVEGQLLADDALIVALSATKRYAWNTACGCYVEIEECREGDR